MAVELLAGKDRFTSLDTLAVVRELRALGRAHVDKAFDLGPERIGISLRAPGAGRRVLVARPGQYAALVPSVAERDEELSPLAKELRRTLGGAALVGAADPGGERYLELELTRGDVPGALRLGIELFAPGNLLVATDEKILAVAHPKTWSKRAVRVGAPFTRPPAHANPWTLTLPEVEAVLRASRTDRGSTFATRLGLGGSLAEEVLTRIGVAGEAPAASEAEDVAPAVHRALSDLVAELGERPKGYLYTLEETAVEVAPFESRRLVGRPGVRVEILETFSEAAHRFFDARVERRPEPDDGATARIEEWKRQRGRQEKAVLDLRGAIAGLNRSADLLLANYPEAERQLAEFRDAGEVSVELEGERIPVERGKSVRSAAQGLYEDAKRLQSKLAGAEKALAETDDRLATSASELLAVRAKTAVASRSEARRTPFWFEKYRWFRSSEGLLVIGGRDAASNDLIVRRYLNPGDRYIHAEIQGAPSVIVKHAAPGEPPGTDASVEEAAQWGVAFSKAWRAGLASGSAFAVESDQVSKSAASGEFVPRGAWVIHGTKTVFKDLPLELGLGTVEERGASIWCVAPPRSLSARGKLLYLLTPGPERERATREVELAREAGLARDRLQSLVPSGGLTFRRA